MTIPSSPPTDGGPASPWEDFVDVFLSPRELFQRRADGKFGLALVVFTVAGALLYFATRSAMAPVMDAEFDRSIAAVMKANPGLTAEQMQGGRKAAETFGAVFVIVGAPVMAFVLGAVVWLVGKLLAGVLSVSQGVTIATFALFPRLLEAALNAIQAGLIDERSITSRFSVSLGVGRFLDPATANPVVFALAGRVDLMTLWITALIGVGLGTIAKIPAGRAALGAALVWVIGALPSLWQAYRTL